MLPINVAALRDQISKTPLEPKDRLILSALALIASQLERIATKN